MIKKILIIAGVCLLAGYIVFAAFFFESKPKETICSNFSIEAADSSSLRFINITEIQKYVDSRNLNPYGKQIKDINTDAIENAILKNKIIRSAEAYISNNGDVHVKIRAKEPILRVLTDNGESYYIDRDSSVMPLSPHFTAYLPIATGNIKTSFAKKELYELALFLKNNEFWNAQIEQIDVQPDKEIVLIPRVGDQKILLGKLDGFEEKLNRLLVFYQKGQNKIGWNNYAVINLKYDKQIVCSKEKM
jgi:cell division protein FtsQ